MQINFKNYILYNSGLQKAFGVKYMVRNHARSQNSLKCDKNNMENKSNVSTISRRKVKLFFFSLMGGKSTCVLFRFMIVEKKIAYLSINFKFHHAFRVDKLEKIQEFIRVHYRLHMLGDKTNYIKSL